MTTFEVVACSNDKQALDYLGSIETKPDAIWLDYYLGDINGLEFMQKVHQNKNWSTIPVRVVSNSANPEKVEKMLELGAKKYMIKAEHRLNDLVSEIGSLCS